ncbi:ORF039L [Rock bream iridovirus]|uniref:ORF039L n=2 Tax=Infectious spleen and kidney necrosis virus TaxID=180170 RepID=Q5YF48_ISKNV|nr:ORF039L [Rock bream iridovirus]
MSLWVASTTAAALTSTLGGLYGVWDMVHSHRYCRSVSLAATAANNCSSNTVWSTGAVSRIRTSPRLSHGWLYIACSSSGGSAFASKACGTGCMLRFNNM